MNPQNEIRRYKALIDYFLFLSSIPLRDTQPCNVRPFALATWSEPLGTFSTTVLPAAIYACSPTSIGEIKFTLHPIKAPSPTVERYFLLPS